MPRLARPLGVIAVLAAGVGAVLAPWVVLPLLLGAGVAARAMPRWRARRAADARGRLVRDELPDVIDLLRLATSSGLTVRLAVEGVAEHTDGEVARALGGASAPPPGGGRLADGLDDVRSLDPCVEPLIDALASALRHGTALAPALEALAHEARADRRRRVESEARKVPVRLLFPLVACILPSLGLLTVVPVAAAALRSLSSAAT